MCRRPAVKSAATRDSIHLFQNEARCSEAPAKFIRMFLLKGRSESLAITMIIFQRLATVLHDVAGLFRGRVVDLEHAAVTEAASPEHIGDMHLFHPNAPLGFDLRLNGDRDAIDDHRIIRLQSLSAYLFNGHCKRNMNIPRPNVAA